MTLKTATLIALIAVVLNLVFSLSYPLLQSLAPRIQAVFFRVYWILASLIFNAGLILFLAVFYAKQKD